MVDLEDKHRLDFLEIRMELLEEYMEIFLMNDDEYVSFDEFAEKNERYKFLKAVVESGTNE